MRIAWRAEIKSPEFVLRIGIAEISRRVAEHVARAGAIDCNLRIRYPGQVVVPKRDKGIGDEPRLRRAGRLVGMAVGDLAEIVEGAQVITRHAIAIGIHAAEFPLRDRLSLLSGILQRRQRAILIWGALRWMRATAQSVGRRQRGSAWSGGAVECQSWRGAKNMVDHVICAVGTDHNANAKDEPGQACAGGDAADVARRPHNTPSQLLRPDA